MTGSQPEQQDISRLIPAVFRAWREAGVAFLVLRNYEGLPNSTTNDIDVLVHQEALGRAERVLSEAAEGAGFRLHNRARFATLALYFHSSKTLAQVHFDLFTDLKWRGFDFLRCDRFLEHRLDRGLFYVPDTADEAATNLLASMIFTGNVKDKYKSSIASGFRAKPADAEALLARTYGAAHAKFIAQAAIGERWAEIEQRTGALRRALVIRQMMGQPFRTLRSLSKDCLRLAQRFFRPPGLMVALCGSDGSGKSTAAAAMIEGLERTFSPQKGRQYHWKPPLFSARRQAARAPTTDPHAQPPRGMISSMVVFAAHCFEFILGHFFLVRPVLFRGGLVVVDRFHYDLLVDQRRYRLRLPSGLVRFGCAWLPEADLVFLLDAPVEALRRRKQEIAAEEAERQRHAYLELFATLHRGRVIDASRTPGEVAGDLNRAILEYMSERTLRRWPRSAPQTEATRL
jgi:thymidylate kinase